MKDLLILGASGNSREVAEAAIDLGWRITGFLDDDPEKHGIHIDGIPVLGPCAMAEGRSEMCALTFASYKRPRAREVFVAGTRIAPDRWAKIIHPSAYVHRSASLGRGTIVLANAMVGAATTVGEHVFMLQNSILSHDCVVGSYTSIASGAALAGFCKIGDAAYFGINSAVRGSLRIGDGVVVGMLACVTRDVAPNSVVIGNPARLLHVAAPTSH